MRMVCATIFLLVALVSPVVVSAAAQSTASGAPTLIPISGALQTATDEPRTGSVLLVLSLYDGRDDPSPRWVEHQVVTLDAAGKYDVQFGSTLAEGLPADLFSGASVVRWVGVAVENEPEQPRMMLVSVPYAAKAATAAALDGKSASDFVLTTNLAQQVRAALRAEPDGEGGDGPSTSATNTASFLQKGTGGGTEDSAVFETGGNVGVGTTTPVARMHIGAGPDTPTNGNASLYVSNNGDTAMSVRDSTSNAEMAVAVDGSVGIVGMLSGHPLTLYAGGASRMHMATGGNIGIGTASPVTRLHVGAGPDAPANGNSSLYVTNNGDTAMGIRDSTNNAELTVAVDASAGIIGMVTTHALNLFAGGSSRLHITSGGNIGIGTTTPTAKLQVAGNVTVDGNIGAKYQDIAEWVDSAEPLEPGMLVVIDSLATNRVMAAKESYDSRVAGAVSAQPGVVLGESGPGRVLVAQSGRVRVKADAINGPIRPGDILVSSGTKGHAMRSRPTKMGGQSFHRPGTVVGKALEALPAGRGEILVLLTLQ